MPNSIWRFGTYNSFLADPRSGVPYYIINNHFTLEGANPASAFVSVFHIAERSELSNSITDNTTLTSTISDSCNFDSPEGCM